MQNNLSQVGKMVKAMTQMQVKIAQVQKEMSEARIEGTAGGGLVKLVMNGKHEVLEASCNPDILKEDAETVTDLFVAAFNDASNRIEQQTKSRTQELTAGLLPAGIKLPGL